MGSREDFEKSIIRQLLGWYHWDVVLTRTLVMTSIVTAVVSRVGIFALDSHGTWYKWEELSSRQDCGKREENMDREERENSEI